MAETGDPADNVIRPTFGVRAAAPEPAAKGAAPEPVAPGQLRVYGQAAGYLVGLLRDQEGPEGYTHRVIVGRLDLNAIEAVAVVPAHREGEIDAERAAMAILRTLEIIAADQTPSGA